MIVQTDKKLILENYSKILTVAGIGALAGHYSDDIINAYEDADKQLNKAFKTLVDMLMVL
jgi:hypothetical protein